MDVLFGGVVVVLVAGYGLSLLCKAIGWQLPGVREVAKVRAAQRFRQGVVVFVLGLFVLGLFASWLVPYLSAGVGVVAQGAQQAGGAGVPVREVMPVLVGVGLALAYWSVVWVWSGRARSQPGAVARRLAAVVPFAALCMLYAAVG